MIDERVGEFNQRIQLIQDRINQVRSRIVLVKERLEKLNSGHVRRSYYERGTTPKNSKK